MIEGDAYTDPDEIAVVSFLFRPYGAATIYAVGVARLGDTYPMTMLSGKSATVRNLYQGSVDVFRFMP